jgi:hypothetical protein
MAASKYNGVILPALPQTTYPHLLILNTTDDSGNQIYALWVCDQPFKASIDYPDTFCRPKDSNVEVYIANTTSWVWYRGDIATGGDGDADYISVSGEFVWANHNIYMQNRLPDTMPTWDKTAFPYLLLQETCLATTSNNVFPKWWAWYSSEPFVMENLTAPEVGEVAGPLGYGVLSTTTGFADGCQGYYIWVIGLGESGWRTFSNTGIDARLAFDPEEPLNNLNVWSNHDIVGTNGYEIKANSWFELLCYKASEPEAVIVQAPVITSLTGGGTYDKNATAEALTCTATSPDGGTLHYTWYRNGSVVEVDSSHTPSTKVAGMFEYYCRVGNNKYGETVYINSDVLTVKVNSTGGSVVVGKLNAQIVGYVLRMCGVPMAEAIAMMLCRGGQAQTPIVANSYNGYVFPIAPAEFKAYPYMRLSYNSTYGYYYLDGLATVPTTFTVTPAMFGSPYVANGFETAVDFVNGRILLYESDEWEDVSTKNGQGLRRLDSIIWANYDVLNEDGSVYLAASEPIPVYVEMSNYNGNIIPTLLYWNKTKYPYAHIIKRSDGRYEVKCFAELPTTSDTRNGNFNGGASVYSVTNNNNNCWWAFERESNSRKESFLDDILWANYDVLDANGTIYLAASEPVPVSGGSDFDVELEGTELYIKNAPATLNENTLEVE